MPPRTRRLITAEDLYRFELISDVRISPDGRQIVYAAQHIRQNTETIVQNLWLIDLEKGDKPTIRQFTYGDQRDFHARWSPAGGLLAFFSNRKNPEKPPQIYLISISGGESRPLTDIPGRIADFSWSPNGKQLLLTVHKADRETIEREKDEQKKKLGVIARHYDRVFYKLDGVGYLPRERQHLWIVNVKNGRARQITDHPIRDELDPTWSPDGKQIAFLSNWSDDPDLNPDAIELFVMPVKGGEPCRIKTPIGEKALPVFSPDGCWIAYYGIEGTGEWYRNMGLWLVPSDGSAPPRNLTEKYDLHVSSMVLNDMGQPELMPPTWSSDGKRLFFQVAYHGNSHLYSISIDGDRLEPVLAGEGVVGSFSFDNQQSKMAYFSGKIDDPGQVRILDLSMGKDWQLTSSNQELLWSLDLGEIEEAWIKGPVGNDLQGWILKPPGFDPSRRYPSILEIHGGPLTQYGNFFMHEFYFLAAQGYVIHFCNPRGGRGYGEAHAKAIWRDWGNADYADLMAWADYISEKTYIDPQRMGVTGGSYGGYMTVWIIGHTPRFKAAVTQRCVSNFISMWGSSDLNWIFQYELSGKPPFEDFQTYWDHSPIKYIGNASTPTLVIHSEGDLRCPIEQGEQVFVALKKLGVDSEMVRFPEEFHGLSRTGRTDRRIARLNHILRWFDIYLKEASFG